MADGNRSRSMGRYLALACLGMLLPATRVSTVRAEMDPIPLLQQALRFRVTIWTNPRTGLITPAYHCRKASEGCDRRLLEFAHYLKDAGDRNGIDPWLLAAMAFRESGLDPFAVGAVGELGILQLHPLNRGSKHVRFVHDAWYRQRCHKQPGACQREVVDRAAELLRNSMEKCGGDLDKALGMYNSGRCASNSSYAKRVKIEREAMLFAVGLTVDAPTSVLAYSDSDPNDDGTTNDDADRDPMAAAEAEQPVLRITRLDDRPTTDSSHEGAAQASVAHSANAH
jgi:hypothetical protein